MKREPAKHFQDLIVWQKAYQFVLFSYHLSSNFPSNEMYDITSKLMSHLEEVSKLLEAYTSSILASDF